MIPLPIGQLFDAKAFEVRNRVAVAMVGCGILVLGARLLLVQVVRGEQYEQFAAIERVAKVRASAPRGLLLGHEGEVLARNIESHRLELLPHRIQPQRVEPLLQTLRGLLDLTDAEVTAAGAELRRLAGKRSKPVIMRRDLVSTHCPFDSQRLELVAATDYAFCQTCGRSFEPPPKVATCPVDRKKLVPSGNGDGVHCPACSREFSGAKACPYDETHLHHGHHILRCPMCGRTFDDEVARLRSHAHLLPEARVRTEIQREYPLRYLASHVLGYTSRVNDRDLRPLEEGGDARFQLDDRIGRTGLESALDTLLRGVDGEEVLVRRRGLEERSDVQEMLAELKPMPVIPGLSARLTLDLALQREAKTAMAHVHSGAVVALDVRTGAVRLLYSKPSFDPNSWAGRLTAERKARVDSSPFSPMLNKALHPFPPASVFKVVAAAAGLEQGVVRPSTIHHCPGYYEFGGRRFRCHKHSGHGDVDLRAAIAQSCDVYFYKVGEALGIDALAAMGAEMGFGEATGIELREATGLLPTRAWYEGGRGRYFPGLSLSSAVGQGDVTATPLQVARVYAGLARDGVLPDVTLIERFEAAGAAVTPLLRGADRPMRLQAETLRQLKRGLLAVVQDDIGSGSRARLPGVTVCGKTGTAEAAQRAPSDAPPDIVRWMLDDHAWFVGFAPAEAPEIVVVALVEHGGSGGHVAAPIVQRVLERYFSRRGQPGATAPSAEPAPAAVDEP